MRHIQRAQDTARSTRQTPRRSRRWPVPASRTAANVNPETCATAARQSAHRPRSTPAWAIARLRGCAPRAASGCRMRSRAAPFGLLRAHAFAHQLLGALFNVQADLFGEIVVELAAAEDLGIQFIGDSSWPQLAGDLPGLRTSVMPSNMRSKLEICCSRWRRPEAVIW